MYIRTEENWCFVTYSTLVWTIGGYDLLKFHINKCGKVRVGKLVNLVFPSNGFPKNKDADITYQKKKKKDADMNSIWVLAYRVMGHMV